MPSKSSLSVSLTPEWAAFIADKVQSGEYRSASEVVRAGLRTLTQESRKDQPKGTAPAPCDLSFLDDGSEMGRLMRAHDWSRTALGPLATWPQSLKTTVGILLRSPIPIVLLWGPDGVMIYNDAYSVFAGGRHPLLLGAKVREGWPEVADFNDHVMQVVLGGGTLSYQDQELTLYRKGRAEQVWMNLDYSPVLDESGRPAGVLAIVVETTERVLAEQRVAAEGERFRSLFQKAPGFMAMLRGPEHVFEIVNDSYVQLIGHRDVIGKPVRTALPEIQGQGFLELLDTVFTSGEPFRGHALPVKLQRQPHGPVEERFVDFVYQPISDSTGRVTGIFVEGYDVTERVEGEDKQKLLLRELNHRVKNLFAIASGMVTISARSASTPREMAQVLHGRLNALARANELIRPGLIGTEQDQDRTTLDQLVKTILLPYVDEARAKDQECIIIDGPAVPVGGNAVTSLALALHETATNAAKYGALAAPKGCIRVDWHVKDTDLHLRWEETDGPALTSPPQIQGFGSSLVQRSIAGQLHGQIKYDWRQDGVTVHVTVPLERLSQ